MNKSIVSLGLALALLGAAPLSQAQWGMGGATGEVSESNGNVEIVGVGHERNFVGTGGRLTIDGTSNRITVSGPLSSVVVTGANNTVYVDEVRSVEITGAGSKVFYKSAPTKTGRPSSKVVGAGASVSKQR